MLLVRRAFPLAIPSYVVSPSGFMWFHVVSNLCTLVIVSSTDNLAFECNSVEVKTKAV